MSDYDDLMELIEEIGALEVSISAYERTCKAALLELHQLRTRKNELVLKAKPLAKELARVVDNV